MNKQRLIDTERAHHLAILGGGAHQTAETRAGEQEMQREQHGGTDHDQKQVIARQATSQDLDRIAQAGRARPEQVFRAPDPEHGVVDHQQQRERREQLEQLRRTIDASQQDDLDCPADQPDHDRGGDDAAPEAEPAADLQREARRDVRAQHVQRAVGDVDDAGDAEDQRQADGDEEQPGRGGEPIERLEQEGVEAHGSRLRSDGESATARLAHARSLPPCGGGLGRGCVLARRFLVPPP